MLREDTILAAGCILPLSSNPRISAALGTRHRAALGLSEETDAAVIVVSEQTGAISVCYRGTMRHRLNEGELRSELSRIFRIQPGDEITPPPAEDAAAEETGSDAAGEAGSEIGERGGEEAAG